MLYIPLATLMDATRKQLAAAALDILPQAILVCESAGRIVLRNQAAAAMLPAGDDLQRVLSFEGRCVVDWPGPGEAPDHDDPTEHRDVILAGRTNTQLTADIFVRSLSSDGLSADNGGALVVVEDVTARVLMERRLATSERMAAVGKLAATVAHELNNPLDAILRYVGMAERASDEKRTTYLQRARDGLGRMGGVIRELLARTRDGQASAASAPIDKLIAEAIEVMEARARAIGVASSCDFDDDASVPVPGELFGVFCNIVKNALDAMPGGGLLSIRLRRTDDVLEATFTDTGVGLQHADAERIFEPFYTTKCHGEGAGLGLAVCKDTLGRFGGTITASPRAEGGTVFAVRLPCERPKPSRRKDNGQ